jgi:hypothetical protein
VHPVGLGDNKSQVEVAIISLELTIKRVSSCSNPTPLVLDSCRMSTHVRVLSVCTLYPQFSRRDQTSSQIHCSGITIRCFHSQSQWLLQSMAMDRSISPLLFRPIDALLQFSRSQLLSQLRDALLSLLTLLHTWSNLLDG